MAYFDAYEYLEKTVEETNHRPSKTRDSDRDIDREKGHRRRDERNSGRSSGDRERKRERSRSRDRDYRRSRVKREEPEKQPTTEADPERDQRTVFAYQIPLRVKEREVYEFFSKAGKVRDVRLIMDRNSRRSKGCGYVEFFEVMSVPAAIALSGHPLLGQPVMVKPSEAEKNLDQSSSSGSTAVHERKLYVENLHFNMNELQLRQIFEPFGQIENVQLPVNPDTGHCKGYGFVQFALAECARAAKNLNGKVEIVGRTIKVSEYHPGVQDSGFDHIDDDDDGRLALNANSRASLMAKLDRSGVAMLAINAPTMSVPPAIVATQVLNSEPIGYPSECLLLRNMFDPVATRESNPEFVLDIGEDVSEECSRYGAVKHVYVDGDSCGGYVYLRFVSVEAAARAQQALHNRWFACRQISAIFLQPYEYDAKFRGLTT